MKDTRIVFGLERWLKERPGIPAGHGCRWPNNRKPPIWIGDCCGCSKEDFQKEKEDLKQKTNFTSYELWLVARHPMGEW